jgi:N utilization substance protein B
MRARTFAREIAFQVLYQGDLNPEGDETLRTVTDKFQDKARQTLEIMEFVRHLVRLLDREEPEAAEEETLYNQWLRTPDLVEFTRILVAGVQAECSEIDDRLAAAAAHWSLHRMAATDRNLLRLGAYELLFTETPPRVVIDEAVELAKRFGGAQSAQFVNGILDNLMHQIKPATADAR